MERPRKLHIAIINLRGAQTELIHAIQASVVVLYANNTSNKDINQI